MLRDYVDATVGFQQVAALTNKLSKSLMRMLGPHGNSQARKRFQTIDCLQRRERFRHKVQTVRYRRSGGPTSQRIRFPALLHRP